MRATKERPEAGAPPERPKPIEPNFAGIPDELKAQPRWVCWAYQWNEPKNKPGKWTKVPKRFGRTNASSTNAKTWSTFDKTADVFDRSRNLLDGIGFVFNDADDDIIGIDLDKARDPQTGVPLEWAKPILERFAGTYIEASPSGTGYHIFARGKKPGDRGRKARYGGGEVEMYSKGRFFTVTGRRDTDAATVIDRQDAIDWLYGEVYGREKPKPSRNGARVSRLPTLRQNGRSTAEAVAVLDPATPDNCGFQGSDDELLDKAFGAKNGDKVRRLFGGDTAGYPSPSEAEYALAGMLAFYTGPDPPRLERLMRQSSLARDKWDTPRGSSTYIADTCANVLEGRTEFHSPASRLPAGEIDAAPEARALLAEHGRDDQGRRTVRRHREQFYQYTGKKYSERSDDDIRATVTKWLDQSYFKLTRSAVGNVFAMVQAECHVASSIKMPTWLGDGPRHPNLIAVENGLLDIEAAVAVRADALRPHSPEWFSTICLPYLFDPTADCPTWLAAIQRSLAGDDQRIAVVQEWFGYCLMPTTDLQRFLMILGDGATGKSTVLAALIALLGTSNISSVPLERFGDRFALFQSLGKLANVAAEIGEVDRVAEGYLKALTSGDPFEFERKHRDPITATPTARLVFSTNNFPRFADRTGGLWRRLLLVPFTEVVPVSERIAGMDKPGWWQDRGEMPGVLNWALKGLRRLLAQGRFTRSSVVEAAVAEHRRESNPAQLFLAEYYREHEHGTEPKAEVFAQYLDWCTRTNHRPLTDGNFAKELVRTFPTARVERPRVDGGRVRCWVGITRGAMDGADELADAGEF